MDLIAYFEQYLLRLQGYLKLELLLLKFCYGPEWVFISLCSVFASNINLKVLTATIEVLLIGRSVNKEMSTVFLFLKACYVQVAAVKQAVAVGVALCQRNTQRLVPQESISLWFRLLDRCGILTCY